MADGLSFAASIIAIIQLTAKLTSLGYGYIGGVKRAPDDLRDLMSELISLRQVLTILQNYADANPQSTSALHKLNDKNGGPLQGCALALQRLQLKMEPKDGLRGIWNSLKWPLEETETAQHISRIERHKTLFIFAVTTDHMALAKEIESYIQDVRLIGQGIKSDVEDTKAVVEEIRAGFQDSNLTILDLSTKSAAGFAAQESWRQGQDTFQTLEARKRVLDWIYPDAFDQTHLEIIGGRQENTGKWLLGTPQFQELVRGGQNSSLLWGYGIPGAGKTFLSSTVISCLQDLASAANYGIAYVYFNYMEQDQQKPTAVLASLVKQLSSQISRLPKEIGDLHDSLIHQGKRPTIEELYAVLILVTKSFDKVFFVFDALDECHPEKQRKELLPLFHRMGKDGTSLFLTSRQYPEDIQESFRDAKKIELTAKEEDIETYIRQKIEENSRAKRLVQLGNCQELIVSDLISCAKGMFLLVKFHVEYVCQQTSARQILEALKKLKNSPTERWPLDPTYDRVIKSLFEQPESYIELAIKVLSWLVKARRTLTVKEIQTAVSVESNRYELDELDLRDRATLLEVCASLVTIDETNNTVRLAHYTVQEYLLRKSIIFEDIDLKLAMACTTYLSFDTFTAGACTSLKSLEARRLTYPFLDYAAHFMPFHLKACNEAASVDYLLRFLGSPGSISSYMQAVHAQKVGNLDCEYYKSYPPNEPPLHVASALGHEAVVRLLLEGANFSAPDNDGWERLYLAAHRRDSSVVSLLLEKTAVSNPDNLGMTALHKAATRGHAAVVQLLLEKGADILARSKFGETALHGAVLGGYDKVVRLLVRNGASLSVQNKFGETPLELAVTGGHEVIVQHLLDGGADISRQNNSGATALYIAARLGTKAMVQLLLKGGINTSIQWQDHEGRTELHLAARVRDEEIVQLLLEAGADTSVLDKNKQTALHVAVEWGGQAIVRLLVKAGADTSIQDHRGRTALHLAVRKMDEEIVQLLLRAGADTSIRDHQGQTALYLAARVRNEEIVQLLLEVGANTSVLDKNKQTALHLAVIFEGEAKVQLLLEAGADTSIQDHRGRTALHLAVRKMDEEIVQLLLRAGADTSIRDHEGQTALHIAAAWEDEEIVQLLLKASADTSIQDHRGRTALHLAVIFECEATVRLLRLLLTAGADTSIQDHKGQTALHLAVGLGSEEIVQLLLEAGANLSILDKNDQTALHLAVRWEGEAKVQLLLEAGADTSIQDHEGQTALHLAVRERDEIVQLLLKADADTSIQDDEGQTALYLAVKRGYEEIVQLLLEAGADVSISNRSGTVARQSAEIGVHETAAMSLEKVEQGERASLWESGVE